MNNTKWSVKRTVIKERTDGKKVTAYITVAAGLSWQAARAMCKADRSLHPVREVNRAS